MSVTGGIDIGALERAVGRAIAAALTQTMATFAAAAGQAYAGTRFAATFLVEPAVILTEATLLNPHPLFHLVEAPTAPHTIRARFRPLLHFYWVRAGRWFHGLQVAHPGTQGKAYIGPLFTQAGLALGAALDAQLEALNRVL